MLVLRSLRRTGLERGGHGEVVHRHAEDILGSRLQLRNQFVGDCQSCAQFRGERIGWSEGGSDPGFIYERNRIVAKVPIDDSSSGMRLFPSDGEIVGELAGNGALAPRTSIDVK